MVYAKKFGIATEYQGESFTKPLTKESGAVWDANEVANYEMLDGDGNPVSSGDLTKSLDELTLTVAVPKQDTADLAGVYLLLVHLTDTVNTGFDDVIAEYKITYKEKKA